MLNNRNLFVTIDTEPDCDTRWNRSDPLTFTSVTYGIPKLLRPIWRKHMINPIYFVSPEVVMNDDCCKVLKNEIELGAIIGTHLHSEYVKPKVTIKNPAGKPSLEYPCYAHSKRIEFEKIKNLTNSIRKRLGIKTVWYRAARYGADLDTIHSLKKLGYKYDSSVTPHINWISQGGPNHSTAPDQPYWISKKDFYTAVSENDSVGIQEFPITILGKRLGIFGNILSDNWLLYNWLRPTHMTLFEQKRLIHKFYRKYKNPTFVLMFHSMEIMINKTPFVRSKLAQTLFLNRLGKIIEYINNSILKSN